MKTQSLLVRIIVKCDSLSPQSLPSSEREKTEHDEEQSHEWKSFLVMYFVFCHVGCKVFDALEWSNPKTKCIFMWKDYVWPEE